MTKLNKFHINIGSGLLISSLIIIFIYILWESGIINLPSPIIYYSRQLSSTVADRHKLTSELPIQFYKQEHSLSCEAAVLRMVLNYHGVDVSESEVLANMPFDPTLRSGNVWGDPNLGFVGDIDGKMGVDGYGIYWGPLAITASHWRESRIIKNGTTADLVDNIVAGRPIIIWGYLGRGMPISWITPEGKKINAIDGEHTFIVYGYDGSADNPNGFMLMDPIFGPKYVETDQLLINWDAFGRMGVVVYP